MIRLLMAVYVTLLASEYRSKPKWWKRKKKVDTYLSFAESGVYVRPKSAATKPPSADQGLTTMLSTGRASRPIPQTLVEKEAAAALRLQMPPIPHVGDFVHIEAGPSRFDTPIGRTLTRELLRSDPLRCPRAVVRHVPLDDLARELTFGRFIAPRPTLPRSRGTEKKGRATPKRPRKNHD
jgi:hypothetical protein